MTRQRLPGGRPGYPASARAICPCRASYARLAAAPPRHAACWLCGGQAFMNITVSDADVRTLREFLHDHFRDLQLEIAGTDAKEFRHVLLRQQAAIERLLEQLDAVETLLHAS